MANLKLSGIVTQVSGKFAGSIFQKTANGQILKNNSYSQQHATPLQSARRNKIYLSSQLWRDVSPSDKALWAAAVIDYPYVNKVGDTVYYTGYQLFNMLNQNLELIGNPLISTPPTFVANPLRVLSWNALTTTQIRPRFDGNTVSSGLALYVTPPLNINITNPLPYLKLMQTAPNVGSAGIIFLDSLYTNRFGTLSVGDAVWFTMKFPQRFSGINDGIYPPVQGIVV